jgi:GTP-binding protein EngB required for normal cell division
MLTENQRHHILNLLSHLEHEVQDGIQALTDQDPDALFPRYTDFPEPHRIAALRRHLERLRGAMRRFMETQALSRSNYTAVDAAWGFETRMALARNAVHDLRPSYLRGYGPVDGEGERDARALAAELGLLLDDIARELRHQTLVLPEGMDPEGVVGLMTQIVERHHFFEFRDALRRALANRGGIEVAILGRVSSGKSSLVNALLGRDLLPTGAIPVTAVVTRIHHGDTLRIEGLDADGRTSVIEPEDLAQCIVEGGGQSERMREVTIAVPAAILEPGLVITDTPGLGSLHASASAHALNYLPRCDMGIVAIDASATVSTLDTDLLRALQQAHAQRMVMLTKCDAVTPQALAQQQAYVERVLAEALGEAVPVHPISVDPAQASRFTAWRDAVLRPALDDCLGASVQRGRDRTLQLARQLALRLEQGLREQVPPPPAADKASTGTALGRLDEAEQQQRDLCRGLGERGAVTVIREVVDSAGTEPAPQRAALVAGELADQVVRDMLAALQQCLAEAGVAHGEQWLRGAPPFTWTVPERAWVEPSGPLFWPRWRLKNKLEHHLGAPLRAAMADYARQLQDWLAATCRLLRRQLATASQNEPAAPGDKEAMKHDLACLQEWLQESRAPD